MSREDYILETEGPTKSFQGFMAIRNVSLRMRRHSVCALLGPNGAGKTACFNLLATSLPATSGRVPLDDRDITRSNPSAVARLGLVRSFQISDVFGHMSVLENVRVRSGMADFRKRLATSTVSQGKGCFRDPCRRIRLRLGDWSLPRFCIRSDVDWS